jgi:hemerythrin-like domain-containing protein
MKKSTNLFRFSKKDTNHGRRKFVNNIVLLSASSVIGLGTLSSCQKEKEEEEITPSEDLMREHGLLSRILLIYDACRSFLINNEQFDPTVLSNSAGIIRSFIEDYHEKLEEDFLFPLFEKASMLTDLVQVLRTQHEAGRILTDQIISFVAVKGIAGPDENSTLIRLLDNFNRMYRPHKSREDTILFPAIKKIISKEEYLDLGEKFEDREHELFGESGFESMVAKVENIEKQINIYDLSQFNPA